MNNRFDEVITSREQLRDIIPEPTFAPDKKIDHIDDLFQRFIAACPFIVLSSRGSDDKVAMSPRGDPAGFVMVLDEKTLAIPNRLGNQRIDSYENLLSDP
ncbi:MAG: pyridoxamine 5'-phosphate oxidase family protein, partial [Alphaproteobacteria bacterium]|nr:pyridoxamine 5'-phosphate oxidase family protein [Alphaproteobacteria bacterium]